MRLLIFLILLLPMTSYTQDWANLARFKEDNAHVLESKNSGNRVVFMGNSITEGWLNEQLDFFDNPDYINRGISGQTTPQMLLRFRQDVIQLSPKAVVILAGINDIAENTGPITVQDIFNNIKSMIDLARFHEINVVLCSVLPAAEFTWRPAIDPREKVAKLNEMLKAYASHNNLTYVDYYEAMNNGKQGLPEKYSYDGVHPTLQGYHIMEPLVKKGIDNALNSN